MKNRLFFAGIFMLVNVAFTGAQDIIFLRTGKEIHGRVTDITPKYIQYLKSTNLMGPEYSILRIRVERILFENGEEEIITLDKKEQKAWDRSQPKDPTMPNNRFSIGFERKENLGRLYSNQTGFSMAFEALTAKNVSLRFPLNFLFTKFDGERYFHAFYTGVGLQFYVNKHKIIRGFIGPETTYGYVHDYREHEYSLKGNFGLSINPVELLNISISAGVGYYLETWKFGNNHHGLTWRLGATTGINF